MVASMKAGKSQREKYGIPRNQIKTRNAYGCFKESREIPEKNKINQKWRFNFTVNEARAMTQKPPSNKNRENAYTCHGSARNTKIVYKCAGQYIHSTRMASVFFKKV
jgi:hypothetical protein